MSTTPPTPLSLHPQTLAAQGGHGFADPFHELVPPIHVATTYERAGDGSYPGGRVYARDENPTFDAPEALIAALEGARHALLFASGQAAAGAVFQALSPGDKVLVPRNMYWGLRGWLQGFAASWGLVIESYVNDSLDDLAARARERRPRLIWIETPANPTWDITDIAGACAIARETGARVAVDSTCATPLLTQPLRLGADIVMHSATKYLNGHSDVIAGALASRTDDDLWRRIGQIRSGGGAILGAVESALLLRGMRTLHLRVHTASATALALASAMQQHAAVSHVLYPGLPTHPQHSVAARQMQGGYGGMMSLRLAAGEAAAKAFTARLRVFRRATSLGSVESLAEHRASVEGPASTCPPDLVRLSIGIEHPADLLADLEQALV